MEKFAVDLDAVLDEFEFHEDQAEKVAGRNSPSVTGFFSPDSEASPNPPLNLLNSQQENQSSPSQTSPSSIRYDLPPSKSSTLVSASPLSSLLEQESNICPPSLAALSQENITRSRLKVHQENNVEKENVDPNEATGEIDELIVTTKSAIETSSDSSVNSGVSDSNKDNIGDSELPPPCYATAVSLMDEINEVAFTPNDKLKVSNHDDDYVDQHQVAEYLEQIKVENDNYVDENQIQKYLKEIELEKNEQKLLEQVDDLDHPSAGADTMLVTTGLSEEDPELDTLQYCGNSYAETVNENSDNLCRNTSEDSACLKPTGTRPKNALEPNTSSELPLSTVSDILTSLEPSIPLPEHDQTQAPYVEEAEYLDLDSLETELKPQIGTGVDSEKSTDRGTESPPPYSEVDPMMKTGCAIDPGVVSESPASSIRPTSLDLKASGTPVAASTSTDSESISNEAVLGAPGATPSNPNGPRVGQSSVLAGLSEDQLLLGRVQPFWVPDSDAPNCMICGTKFTMVKRRHHCRACGKVLCAPCCSEKHSLHYAEGKEGRVCTPCRTILTRLAAAETANSSDTGMAEPAAPPGSSQVDGSNRRPNPANPMEYCSTVPVAEQVAAAGALSPPSVLVPVGVLKRGGGSTSGSVEAERENKSVMFSDGIRPGGDLTELDGRGGGEHRTLGRRAGRGRSRQRRGRVGGPVGAQDVCASMLPPEGLPLVSGRGAVDEEEVLVWFSAGTYVNFVMNKNLTVVTKQLHYPPINKLCWNFATRGLTSVGQDEVVILLEVAEDEQLPPRDVFCTLQALYEQAGAGQPIAEMGHISVGSDYLGSSAHGGWLFIRHTHQTVADLLLPPPPLLFGVLIMRWEIPWARVFPLRLMLRLGAEFRYYPAPLVSVRGRKPVYGEIGHTIMNVLADFKNYTYALPTIRGLVIHMSTGRTDILLPKNRYDAVLKALNTSNETVLAMGSNFSTSADSHLVAIQGEDGNYQTQAINILNKERKVTGASFVVFNGALKSTANLTAKSSIVEDGLMVQVLPDNMVNVRKALKNMENYLVGCGPVGASEPDEVVSITWVDEDKAFNIGIKSVLDGKAMDGISSLRIHSGPDMTQDRCLIRWTEVFLINTGDKGSPIHGDPPDPARAAEGVARAVCVALMPHLLQLKEEGLSPLAVRVSLEPDNVMYEAGSNGTPLPPTYMNSLDCELVPVLHSGSIQGHLTLELVFHILDH